MPSCLSTRLTLKPKSMSYITVPRLIMNHFKPAYILLNKPIGFSDETAHALLTKTNGLGSNVRDISESLQIIAPLPEDAEGLLVYASSSSGLSIEQETLEKEYEVIITERLTKEAQHILGKGLQLETGFANGITVKKTFNKGRQVIVTVVLRGNDVRLRPMFERIGYTVTTLRRTKVGIWKLATLPVGRWRMVE